ncbi:MAG: DNA-binding protein WhiA [Oscillospiraceae bacterium]|nr:DNA-binding protein WhiA [Oscillospiraceae bacterium]
MSFSMEVKNEICRDIEQINSEQALCIISAMMKIAGSINLLGLNKLSFSMTTENASIARFLFSLIKKFFNIHCEIIVKKSKTLKKNNKYVIRSKDSLDITDFLKKIYVFIEKDDSILITHKIPSILDNSIDLRRYYIQGAFLGGGSLSNPEKAYHLEFVCEDEEFAEDLSRLINTFNINSKIITRKRNYVIYIKESEQIVDILNIIRAHQALLKLENIRIIKEMRNNVNRIVNCETANLTKTVDSSIKHIENIKLIKKEIGLNRIPKILIDVAEVRLKYPDESLKEIGDRLIPSLGKSGVNHRLRKIDKIAEEIRKNK